MDRFGGLTAEKLIYSHTVHMVSSAKNIDKSQTQIILYIYLGVIK